MSFAGPEGHDADIHEVFEGVKGENVENFYKWLSGGMIDDQGADRFFSTLPKPPGQSSTGLTHRDLFHWGFSDSIPFNKNPKLKEYLAKFPVSEREKIKKMIIEEWQRRVNQAIDESMVVFGIPSNMRSQAKGLVGLIYDTHILGDYKPNSKNTNKVLEPLQDIEALVRDIKKNLHRCFGKNSNFIKQIENRINSIPVSVRKDASQYAMEVLKILKEEKIGQLLYERRIIRFKAIAKGVDVTIALMTNPKFQVVASLAGEMSSKYNAILSRIPSESARLAVQGASITALVSSLGHGWNVFKGEEQWTEGLAHVAEDTVLSGTSILISEGIIQHISGGKYCITALVEDAAKEAGANIATQSIGAFLNYGLATFVFDETRNVYFLLDGKINKREFYKETQKSILNSIVSGSSAYCATLIVGSAAGPIVAAVAIGGYLISAKTQQYCEAINERNYFFVEDVLGYLPLDIQRKPTLFNLSDWGATPSLFQSNGDTPSMFKSIGETPFFDNIECETPSLFE